MNDAATVFALIVVVVALFMWNKIPAVIVGVGVSLALFFTGILTANEALAGFGDPTIVLIAGLFVVAAGLEASGVTAWASQLLIERSGGSETRAFILLIVLASIATATISVNGTVASLLPVVVVVAVRLGVPTSQLLIPLCFASHSATMLTLLGAPLNVLGSQTARDAGYGGIGFFEFAIAGIPMLLGSAVIMLLTRRFLLPHRNGESLPRDFSAHAQTLVEQYRLQDGLHRLRCGRPRRTLESRGLTSTSTAIRGCRSLPCKVKTAGPCNDRQLWTATFCLCAVTKRPRAGSPPTSILHSVQTKVQAASRKPCSTRARAWQKS